MIEKMFPVYLNQDSHGPAVVILQIILKSGGFADPELVVNGDYGEFTVDAVKGLQKELGVEVDGNFGPMTRAAYLDKVGLDVNLLTKSLFIGETVPTIIPTPAEQESEVGKPKTITIETPDGKRTCEITQDTPLNELIGSDFGSFKYTFEVDGQPVEFHTVVTRSNNSITVKQKPNVHYGN